MFKRLWLLALVAPLLFGCGSGLEEGGRIPIPKPFALSADEEFTMTINSPATYRATGSFDDVSTQLNVSAVKRYILFQPLKSSARVETTQPSLPDTITLSQFEADIVLRDSENSVTFNLQTGREIAPDQAITLRKQQDGSWTVEVTGGGLRAVIEQEPEKLLQLARIVTSGGPNTVEVTLRANVAPDGLSGTRITFTAGVGTGTLEL